MNANPKQHAAILGQTLVSDPQHTLDLDGALDCV